MDLAAPVVPLDAAFFADPHALYERLRVEEPVARAVTPVGMPVWLVTRYDDVREALTDPRLAKDADGFARVLERKPLPPGAQAVFAQELNRHMLSTDPPDHTRLRKLVSRAFTCGPSPPCGPASRRSPAGSPTGWPPVPRRWT